MRGGDNVGVGAFGIAHPLAEVAFMAWSGSMPRDMSLSIQERLNITVCTCEVLSYPNSPATLRLMEAVVVLRPVWPHQELATMARWGSSSEFACCLSLSMTVNWLWWLAALLVPP